jgi:hypothetical protein
MLDLRLLPLPALLLALATAHGLLHGPFLCGGWASAAVSGIPLPATLPLHVPLSIPVFIPVPVHMGIPDRLATTIAIIAVGTPAPLPVRPAGVPFAAARTCPAAARPGSSCSGLCKCALEQATLRLLVRVRLLV